MGLLSGDYLMVPQEHTEELAKELPNLDLVQGYLVHKDADPNLPLQARAASAVPGITYASMRVSVQPLDASSTDKHSAGGVALNLLKPAAANQRAAAKQRAAANHRAAAKRKKATRKNNDRCFSGYSQGARERSSWRQFLNDEKATWH